MMRLAAVLHLLGDLAAPEVEGWIARGWLRPEREASGEWLFAEIDVARARLLRDFRHRLDIDEETLPVVLSLVDQLHDMRRALGQMIAAVEQQPEPVRAAVRTVIWTRRD